MGKDSYLDSYDNAMKGEKYITASQIAAFCECGVEYRRRYIDREATGSSAAAVFGTAGHFAEIEGSLRQKIKSKVDVPVDVVTDMFVEKLQSMKGDIDWSRAERKEGRRKLWRNMQDTGPAVMKKLHLELAPRIQPVSVEAKVIIPLKDFAFSAICGTWDVECSRDIYDFKFRGKTPSQADIDSNTGLTVYSMAKTLKDGRPPRSIHMAGIVRLKTPKLFDLTTKRDESDFHKLLLTVNKIHKSIEAGIFLPASPISSWKCSEKFCSYFNSCNEKLKR
jgi:hypothetical protein